MSNLLSAVTRASKRREKVCADSYGAYLAAIEAARAGGHTLQEIADAAGLKTRSGAKYLLSIDRRPTKSRGPDGMFK